MSNKPLTVILKELSPFTPSDLIQMHRSNPKTLYPETLSTPDITHPARPIHPSQSLQHFSTLSLTLSKFKWGLSLCLPFWSSAPQPLGHVLDSWQPTLKIWLTGGPTNSTSTGHNITQRQVFPRQQLQQPSLSWPAHTGLVFIPRALRGI